MVSANEYSFAHGAQLNFGDLTPYLTYAWKNWLPAVQRSAVHFLKKLPTFRHRSPVIKGTVTCDGLSFKPFKDREHHFNLPRKKKIQKIISLDKPDTIVL